MLQKAKTTPEEDSSISSSAWTGAAPSSSVPVSEESVDASDVILRALDLARALANEAVAKARAAVAAIAGAKSEPKWTERSAEKYGERMESRKVEFRIKAQIRAAGEVEEARARATATRWRRAYTHLPEIGRASCR